MIGVVVHASETELAREFFELFKTPWELYRPEGRYDVLLVAREDVSARDFTANVLIVYGGQGTRIDEENAIEVTSHRQRAILSYKGSSLPLYGNSLTLQAEGAGFLRDESAQQEVGFLHRAGCKVLARIGYDLFREMRSLLTEGQPTEQAHIPTLEMHIAVLRDLIVESGVTLVEIPPFPDGYKFTVCLTHDVDHPSIRRHRWDHTMFGFMYRAVLGSLVGVLRGRLPVRDLLVNWGAVVKLPFIHLGLADDFWDDFDRYRDIERDSDSTFFVLPFKDEPGQTARGQAPRRRASSYGAADIAERLQRLNSLGREVGLHGIDAWIDSLRGKQERDEIVQITGGQNVGVRMHWLYFDANSPVVLEKAGFSYDSTLGYNHTIGYRMGTTQVFKFLQATKLLELPMHIMDTALFRPNYLNLTYDQAAQRIGDMIDGVVKFGGALTINWHDRSIAPERLWGDFYAKLVDELKGKGAWCTSAGRAVIWFQQRRSVAFHNVDQSVEITVPNVTENSDNRIPDLKVRVYNSMTSSTDSSHAYIDTTLATTMKIPLTGCQSLDCQ